jgi:hypothetical protein
MMSGGQIRSRMGQSPVLARNRTSTVADRRAPAGTQRSAPKSADSVSTETECALIILRLRSCVGAFSNGKPASTRSAARPRERACGAPKARVNALMPGERSLASSSMRAGILAKEEPHDDHHHYRL